jgi:hypothetical protein
MANDYSDAIACTELPGWREVRWDPLSGAEQYGAFAALLAGFSIAGLIWIASRRRDDVDSRALVGLWVAVLPLVLSTLLFAEVAADSYCGRSVVIYTAPSFLLTVGAVMLFVHLGNLLAGFISEGSDPAEGVAARQANVLVRWFVAVVASGGIVSANLSMLDSVEKGSPAQAGGQAVLVGATLVLAGAASHDRWNQFVAGVRRPFGQAQNLRSYFVLLLTAAVYLGMFVVAFQDRLPTWLPLVVAWTRSVLWSAFILATVGGLRGWAMGAPASTTASPAP